MAGPTEAGLLRVQSPHPFDATVERLRAVLAAKGITLFAVMNHAAEAAKAGLSMPPTQVFLFGNPRAGTPLMLAAPSLALDLPLKILVAEECGVTSLTYSSAATLAHRHGLPEDLMAPLAAVEALVNAVTA